ncbi:GNAT family N-acetyltransferase [Streptomyces longispororuber]|uniref:GNAT family N-acetyltransferase n=1 Tax=Streptomyces TaxID=1883 RepID=UPI0024A7AFDD|nr:GNAT family N-acetyltransferase [Streptomyces sp. CC224B]
MKVLMRPAQPADLESILRLLAQDAILEVPVETGPPVPQYYVDAFARISADPGQLLAVAEVQGEVVGTFQVSFIPYLLWRGGLVAQIESVRVAEHLRGQRVGEQMMRWAVEQARSRGCARVQLSTHKTRDRAHRFYERLGFRATHEGMKLFLGV